LVARGIAKVTPFFLVIALLAGGCARPERPSEDGIRDLQIDGVRDGRHDVVRWGPDPALVVSWHSHTNRLVPVYAFGTGGGGPGLDLSSYTGANSAYRDADRLTALYGRLPENTVTPEADYMDQTDLAAIQRAAVEAGRRHVFVVVFDGMDWDTVRAAATYVAKNADFDSGRGDALHFQRYDASGTTQFAFAVTSPTDDRHEGQVETQDVIDTGDGAYGGYDGRRGGSVPWSPGDRPEYVTGKTRDGAVRHAVTDSAASATAIFSGVKTYNGAINVDQGGRQVSPVAHEMQAAGFAVGMVTSVPISHATPAAAYAHGVSRYDYQDLTRDLLGLPSAAHPDRPLPGVDVLIGCGHGAEREEDRRQGSNFVPGNRFIVDEDLRRVDAEQGGEYVLALRTAEVDGGSRLQEAASEAARSGRRLLGIYGSSFDGEHLPYRTADGDFVPVPSFEWPAEQYTEADLVENPTLAEMTGAALEVLSAREAGFWLLVEAGDVDWAAHDANIDNVIGSVISGDEAVEVITDWVESNSDWNESLLIVTADHGHYLVIVDPGGLAGRPR
jgi:alkaline phosphatase